MYIYYIFTDIYLCHINATSLSIVSNCVDVNHGNTSSINIPTYCVTLLGML
jgi:hypothetical protein